MHCLPHWFRCTVKSIEKLKQYMAKSNYIKILLTLANLSNLKTKKYLVRNKMKINKINNLIQHINKEINIIIQRSTQNHVLMHNVINH